MKRTTLQILALALAILSSFVIPHSSFAQTASPALIPFQGRLTDQQGNAYQTGQFTITFNLYDQAIGGTTVWTERHEKVSVINGMINAFLGSVNPIGTVDFATTKYLGIAVDADANPATPEPEMVPRTMIVAAFHAKKAELATNATQLNGAGWDALLTNADPNAGGAVLKADKIADGVISGAKLANGSVTLDKLVDGAVSTDKLAAGAVTAVKIADGAITGQQIQNGSVANDDLVAGTASANLAAEGLIALGAYPLRVGAAISKQTSGNDVNWENVLTIPPNSYGVLSFFAGQQNLSYPGTWNTFPAIRINGFELPITATQSDNIYVGPGTVVDIRAGHYSNGQIGNVWGQSAISGVVLTSAAP